jgi:NADPH2:quinone reductase
VAWKLGEKSDDPVANYLADIFTLPASLAGLPGLSLPVGFGAAGMPVGLQLIGTAGSDEKCALAKAHGAAHVINYGKEDFEARVKEITGGKGVKVVYDSVGKDTWDKSLECLRPLGLMASFGNASGPVAPFAPGILGPKGSIYVTRQTLFSHITTRESTQEMADDLFAAVTSGKVKIHIDQTFPLANIQDAHIALEARKTTGCTIITL